MTLFQWFIFFLIVQVIHFLGTWKIYVAAGRKAWEAAIPIYNAIILMKIINRPSWWTFLLFVPVINLIMFPVVWVETIRSFGKNSTLDTILVVATLGFYIYYLNYTQSLQYINERSLLPTNKVAETVSSLLFAIVVATLVHTYVMQPFTIPSSSLEKSLLIGDFLFVSKVNYGPRPQMTAVALPMVHDSIPLVGSLSYFKKPQYPYFRFPGFEKIKNNDIVVFNWPRDTLDHMYQPSPTRIDKPIDKKTNYVKRCVGIAGDNLEIKKGIVFINGKELILPERAKPQFYFTVKSKEPLDNSLLEDYQISEFERVFTIENKLWDNTVVQDFLQNENIEIQEVARDSVNVFISGRFSEAVFSKLGLTVSDRYANLNLTYEKAERMKTDSRIEKLAQYVRKGPEDGIFPDMKDGKRSTTNTWSCDNYGPIYIPKAGKTISLTKKEVAIYKNIITEFEGNTLKIVGDDIYINDKIAKTYTFQKDYYWMMGDNRHNSLDARYYGFTPHDHVVGKPVFIWMSWDTNGKGINKIRWDRMFTFVSGDGQPQSYFKYFMIFLGLYFVGEYFWKKRKEKTV